MSILTFEKSKIEKNNSIELFKCEQCNKTFLTVTSLVSHLTNNSSPCKTNIKEYYDKYLKSSNEGICKFCGRDTAFYSISKGYPNDVCKHCKNSRNSTQIKRRKTFNENKEKRKQKLGYYELPEFCEICKLEGKDIRFKNRAGLSRHISMIHKVTAQEYYDKYLKKDPNEGICPITGEDTNFKNLTEGYFKYKGRGYNSADKDIQEQKRQTLLKNYGVENPIFANSEQRIDNFKKHFEELRELKNTRFELITLLRKQTIDKNDKFQCQLCGLKYNNFNSITTHIRSHNINLEDYYKQHFLTEGEGICPSSGKETSFIGLREGYLRYKENFQSHPDIVNKIKESLLKNIRRKVLKNCYKYNVAILDINELKTITSSIHLQCLKCNHVYHNRIYNLQLGYGKCPICNPRPIYNTSEGEREIYQFVRDSLSNDIDIYKNYYDISLKNPLTGREFELDIYIPSMNFAIEYNGIYYHSDQIKKDNATVVHLNKYKVCKQNGIDLIQIFEDEWNDPNRQNIIKKMILHKLGLSTENKIYARNCYIKEIDAKLKNEFLDKNHIQGADKSRFKLGLFKNDDNELISVMTFSGKNLSRGTINIGPDVWELSRFATKLDYIVVGAAGKLLKYFQNNFEWSKIFSYADLRYSNGDLYKTLGFEFISQSPPNYWYVKNNSRIHRFNLRKRPDEPIDVPEWILRLNEGYYRIWDCGLLKFEINNANLY